MSNRNWASSRLYNQHMLLRHIDAIVQIGASGAPTINTGDAPGINSITRLSAGRYRIQLQDNYAKLLTFYATARSPVTGSALNVDASDAALSVGTVYQIFTLGTTTTADWIALGLPVGITPTVGVSFKAAVTGSGVGTGTVKAIGFSGIQSFEQINASSALLNTQPFQIPNGGYVDFQCVGPTNSSTTTPIAVDPANGSSLHIAITFNDSKVQ